MSRQMDLVTTAVAPSIWGSTYLVTTELLAHVHPLTVAMLRALPAGLLLLLWVRQLPQGLWWGRVMVLGALNFSIFWSMLFVAAYRLPGGVAATVLAVQPLLVIFLARGLLGSTIRGMSLLAAGIGVIGVAMLILTPQASLDPLGILAGLVGAASMAAGTVLTRRWQPPVSPLTFTAWQLSAGGLLLVPFTLWQGLPLNPLNPGNIAGLTYLGLIGAAMTYMLWFRGIARLSPAVVSTLGFLSPLTAVLLGWVVLGQALSALQITGMALVLAGVWLSQRSEAVSPRSLHRESASPLSSRNVGRIASLSSTGD